MSTQRTSTSAGIASAIGTTLALSALGGAVVWFSTSNVGHASTAAVIGLVIGLAIFVVSAASSRKR